MTMPADAPIFAVRATLADGARRRLGLSATEDDAAEQAALLRATGTARRVETVKRVQGRVELVAVAGRRSGVDRRRQADRW